MRYRKLVGFVIAWLIMKTLLFIAYVLFDGTLIKFEEKHLGLIQENATSCLVEYINVVSHNEPLIIICTVYIIVSCTFGLVIDIHEIIMSHKIWFKNHFYAYFVTIKGRKRFLYDYGNHRLTQTLINLGMLAHVITSRVATFRFRLNSLCFPCVHDQFPCVFQYINIKYYFYRWPPLPFTAILSSLLFNSNIKSSAFNYKNTLPC